MAFAASTAPHDLRSSPGDMQSVRMGITRIAKGDIVLLHTDGYVYSPILTGATGDQFVGIAAETVDNRYITEGDVNSGASALGARQIRVWLEGIFELDIDTATIETELGLTAWATVGAGTDSCRKIVTAATGHPCIVGQVVELTRPTQVAATKCRVRISAWSAVAT